MRLSRCFAALILISSTFGCGDDDGGADAASDASTQMGKSPRFEPSVTPMPFGAIPFPDDLYLDEKGRIALSSMPNSDVPSDYGDSLLEALANLDGFGSVTPIFFPVPAGIDPSSLPASDAASLEDEASLYLMDVDSGSPRAFKRIPVISKWIPRLNMIAVRPADGHPLVPSRQYAAVLTQRVLDMDGLPLSAPADFLSVRDASARPDAATLGRVYDHYAPVLANLRANDVDSESIVALAVFHVQSVSDGLIQARELIWNDTLPEVVIDEIVTGEALDDRLGAPSGNDAGLGVAGGVKHEAIASMVHGRFSAPWFISEDAKGHGYFVGPSGEAQIKSRDDIAFSLFVPKDINSALPVVMFQHGITADRSDALGIANSLCEAGFLVYSHDAPFHGLRATGASVDTTNRFTDEAIADSFGDLGGASIVFSFAGIFDTNSELIAFHPVYLGDTLRQSAADLMSAVRVLRQSDWAMLLGDEPSLAELSVSSDPFAFVGNSFGGIMGSLFVAHEPEVASAVFAVTGGTLTHMVAQSPSFNSAYLPQLFPLLGLQLDEVDYAELHPSFYPEIAIWQTLLDRGDPMAYTAKLRNTKTDMMFMMSREDETVPNVSTEGLARASGAETLSATNYVDLPTVTPPLRGNIEVQGQDVTRGLVIYEQASHGLIIWRPGAQSYMRPVQPPFSSIPDVPFVNPIDDAQSQIIHFLESASTGMGEIRANTP